MRDEAAIGELWAEALPAELRGWMADLPLGWLVAEYRQPGRAYHTLAHVFVREADYRAGRTRVLRDFLERPRIYVTAPMFARFEAQARRNLAREIAALELSAG